MKIASSAGLLGVALACFCSANALAQGYGRAVAVTGRVVVVGHPRCSGVTGGCVYTYAKNGEDWLESATIMSPDAAVGDGFGSGLAASGGRLLVTAANSRDGESGRVYVFSRTADGWTPDGTIVPEGLPEGARLGNVVLSGDLAAVAVAIRPEPPALPTDGVVLVLRDTGDEWVQEAVLESPYNRLTRFGSALALGDEVLLVGASRAGALAGAAFIYEPGPDGWGVTGELPNPDGPASFFGTAVLVVGDRILISAGNPSTQLGRVIAFERDGDGWTESDRVQARAHLDELFRHVVVVGAAEGYRKVRLPDETHAKPGGGEEHGLVEATLVEDLQPHLRGGVRVLLYRAVHAAVKAIAAGSEPHALVVGRLDVPAVCAAIENMPVRVYVAFVCHHGFSPSDPIPAAAPSRTG